MKSYLSPRFEQGADQYQADILSESKHQQSLLKKEVQNYAHNVADQQLAHLSERESYQSKLDNTIQRLTEIKKDLRSEKWGNGRPVRKEVKQYLRELKVFMKNLNDIKKTPANKLHKAHVDAQIAKAEVFIADMRNFYSQVRTGDRTTDKNFNNPNIFKDDGYYIDVPGAPNRYPRKPVNFVESKKRNPDRISDPITTNINRIEQHRMIYGQSSLGERFGNYGLLGAIDYGAEKAEMSPQTRQRINSVGNTIYTIAKWGIGLKVGREFLKNSRKYIKGEKKEKGSYGSDALKYGAMLAGGYIFGPSLEKLIKGGDTSQRAKEKLSGLLNKNDPKLTEVELSTAVSHTILGDMPWKDIQYCTDRDGKLNYKKLEQYIVSKHGKDSQQYQLLQEQQASRPAIQNYVTTITGVGPTYLKEKVKRHPDENFRQTAEEIKNEADAVVENYEGRDDLNIRPTLMIIRDELRINGSEQFEQFNASINEIEKHLNILHDQHPKAEIGLDYNEKLGIINISSYGVSQELILKPNGQVAIRTPYHQQEWNTRDVGEGLRVANLINFLTTPKHGFIRGSSDPEPFNVSIPLNNLEYSRHETFTGWSTKKRDTRILKNTIGLNMFGRMKYDFPSIYKNIEGFADWLNQFVDQDNKSLWDISKSNNI